MIVEEVVIGGLFALVTALVSGWLVDGGIKRRARRTIREELELAELSGCPPREAAALRASAERRLHRYVTPLRQRLRDLSRRDRAGAWIGGVIVALGSVGGAVAVFLASPGADDARQVFAVAGLLGLAAGITFAILEFGFERIARTLGSLLDSVGAGYMAAADGAATAWEAASRALTKGRRR